MDFFFHLYDSTPEWLHWIGNFLFTVVFIRGIVANEITKEVRKWGNQLKVKWDKSIRSERRQAIWMHFQERAKGHGHTKSDVLACHDGQCVIL